MGEYLETIYDIIISKNEAGIKNKLIAWKKEAVIWRIDPNSKEALV